MFLFLFTMHSVNATLTILCYKRQLFKGKCFLNAIIITICFFCKEDPCFIRRTFRFLLSVKGVSLLANYPKPECRSASDIDILVSDPKEYTRTRDLLFSYGFAWQMVRQITMKNFFIMKTTRPIC